MMTNRVVELIPGAAAARELVRQAKSAGLASERIALMKRARAMVPKTFEARMAIQDYDGAAATIPGMNRTVRL